MFTVFQKKVCFFKKHKNYFKACCIFTVALVIAHSKIKYFSNVFKTSIDTIIIITIAYVVVVVVFILPKTVTLWFPAEPAGSDGNAPGGWQPNPTREHRAGQPGGGADLPASVESPEWVRPAERPGPARLPATGASGCLFVHLSVYLSMACANYGSSKAC